MKKKLSVILCICIVIQMFIVAGSAISVDSFRDVDNHWAKGYIEILCERNIINGYSNGTFAPDNALTKGEAAKLICLSAEIAPGSAVPTQIEDIEGHWAKPYISVLPVTPTENKCFYPDQNITRAEFSQMVVGALYLDLPSDVNMIQTRFKDWATIPEPAIPYVALAVEQGIINGYEDSTFRPNATLTRAEACTMLKRAFFADVKLKASKYYIDTVTPASKVTQMTVAKDNTLYYVSDNKVYHAASDRVSHVWNGSTSITFPTSQILQQPVISLDDPCDVDQVRERLEQDAQATFTDFTVAGVICDYQSGNTYVMAWSNIDQYDSTDDLFALILVDVSQPDEVYASAFTAGSLWEYRAGMPNGCSLLMEDDVVIYSSGHDPNEYNLSFARMLRWDLNSNTIRKAAGFSLNRCSAVLCDGEIWYVPTGTNASLTQLYANQRTSLGGGDIYPAGASGTTFYYWGDGMALYSATVDDMSAFTIQVSPQKLVASEDIIPKDQTEYNKYDYQDDSLWAADENGVLYFFDKSHNAIRKIYGI